VTARPNVLVVTCHDVGWHVGCFGNPTIRTPRLDALAREGVRFTRSFCTAPQCSPSRAALFTGRDPHSNGVMGLTHGHFGWQLGEGERHMAAMLRDAGWATAAGGICHEVGDPADVGYEERFGDGTPDGDALAEQAAAYLAGRAAQARPFFLHLGFVEAHRLPAGEGFGAAAPDRDLGVEVPGYLLDEPSARDELAAFQGAIRSLDAAVGRVLDALESHGMRDDTIVLVTTDHGAPFPRAKCTLYDPGLQAFLIVRWPRAAWPAGQARDELISNIDCLPTLLELLGLPVPDALQGHSFAGLLDGTGHIPRTEVFGEMTYHDYLDAMRCIRTERHKLIVSFTSAPSLMDPSQSWRPRTTPRQPPRPGFGPESYHVPLELYDLRADPLELDNLASSPAHEPVLRDLLERLHRWMEDTADPLLDGIPTPPMHRRAIDALARASLTTGGTRYEAT
jgi:N-sulfoglucosamine sulfohydrolase